MDNFDLLIWAVTSINAIGLLYIAFKKSGSERASLSGSGAESFSRAAQMTADENIELRGEIGDLRKRIEVIEQKKYRITIEFTIGDPPTVGVVRIEPIVEQKQKATIKKGER